MVLTYIDENGTSYDLPKLTKSLNAIIRDVDININKGLEDIAYTKMLELVKKCLGEEVVKELFGSSKYDDNLYLTELNVACVEIAKIYRKPIEEARMSGENLEQVTKLLESMGNIKEVKNLVK